MRDKREENEASKTAWELFEKTGPVDHEGDLPAFYLYVNILQRSKLFRLIRGGEDLDLSRQAVGLSRSNR